ncbi:MAG: glycine--tRNA ligase subunit beta, partial [Armatimonadetes bacterium]|nr:glycine--tRNA ligase subunit beta [Armatimonadota bacterium]
MTADLLFEIGVEEIPATAVLPALEQLRQLVESALERLRLEHGAVQVWGTPRRLTALAQAVATRQADAVT